VIVTVIAAAELVAAELVAAELAAAAAAELVAAEPVAAAVSDLLVSHAVILRQNVAAAFVVAAEFVAAFVAAAAFVVAAFAAASDLLMVPLVKKIHQLAVLAAATFVASVAAAFLAHPQAKSGYFVSKVTQYDLSRYDCKMRSTGEATEAWNQTLNFWFQHHSVVRCNLDLNEYSQYTNGAWLTDGKA